MHILSIHRRYSVAAAAVFGAITLVPVNLAPHQAAAPAVTFTATTEVVIPEALQQMISPLYVTGTGTATAGKVRVDLANARNAAGTVTQGDYLVIAEPGHTTIVRPSLKTYADFGGDFQDPFSGMTDTNDQIVVGDVPARFTLLGAGDAIEGRATQHYQLKTGYSANMPDHSVSTSIVIDVWTAKLPVQITNPLLAFGAPRSAPISALRQRMAQAFAQFTNESVIKTVTTTYLTVNNENNSTVVQTTTLTGIKDGVADAALFTIPTGFTKVAR